MPVAVFGRYIVAGLYHYRANTYDSTIAYLANKLWQRPLDLSLAISFLLRDRYWRKYISAKEIGVAGHSQGGFTALWIGGATVNPQRYLAFQRGWRNNPAVPAYLRNSLPVDAGPALHVHDPRIGAVFAMAPGVIPAFGMDAGGLAHLNIPTYIVVGGGDTVTPAKENASYAAEYAPHAQLEIIPGSVGHNVFVNECNQEGKDELPELCVDAQGVNRNRIHARVGQAALKFFDTYL